VRVVVSVVTPQRDSGRCRFKRFKKGHLVANCLAQRYDGFTKAMTSSAGLDGGFEITVAVGARAGNWIPTGGIERYALMLLL